MKKAAFIILLLLVGCAGGYTLYDRQQSIASIDTSLNELNTSLKEAEEEGARYSGVIIKATIEMRIQTLKTTIAMLEQKRRSFLHRIALTYTVEGVPFQPASQEHLDKILADVTEVNKRITEASLENERYSGGLIKGLIEMRIQTEKQTLAGLSQQYLFAKYGVVYPAIPSQQPGADPVKERPVVPDKDVL
jgi:hypothetical protein